MFQAGCWLTPLVKAASTTTELAWIPGLVVGKHSGGVKVRL